MECSRMSTTHHGREIFEGLSSYDYRFSTHSRWRCFSCRLGGRWTGHFLETITSNWTLSSDRAFFLVNDSQFVLLDYGRA